MIFNKNTAIVSAALLLSSANAATTRNVAANNQNDAVLRRLAQLEDMIAKQGEMLQQQASTIDNLHEARRLQEGCAPSFNAALGQCVYSAPVRFQASSAFLDPVTFVNDVTIFGPDNSETEFRVEGNVETIFDQDKTFVVKTDTLFADDVFIGDDTSRSSRPSSRDEASLFVDGNVAVLGESYFKDDVSIDSDADLIVEGDLKVEEDAEIDGDLDLDGDLNLEGDLNQ